MTEARILPVEELHSGTVCWVERDSVARPWPIALHHIKNAHLLTDPIWEDFYGETWRTSEYGKQWRLWSAMPSDEQMSEASWDA